MYGGHKGHESMSTANDHSQWYAESLQEIDQSPNHAPHTQFPVLVGLGGQQYQFAIWKGQQLPDQLLAYDTETRAIECNEIPELALATVYGDQGSAYFIHPDQLPQFIQRHSQAYYSCHNATFDFWVTAQQMQNDPQALAAWWDIAGGSRLLCTMLLDMLIRLGRIDAEPISRNLAVVAAEFCGLELNKADPYRLRYGELIGLSAADWCNTEQGFWTYAAKDPIATLKVAQQQFQIAQELIQHYRSELLPDAQRRFGPLTVCLQVQGAIALDYISRTGVQIDREQASRLHDAISELVEQHRAELEQLLPGCLKRYGPRSKRAGELQRTAAGVPKRNAKAIKAKLEQIAKASAEPIRPARVKDGSITDAVKYWSQHVHLDPFVQAYVSYLQQAKLAQFFRNLDQERIFPKYRPLVRTGRCSCSLPNLQQLPRDSRFREIITALIGYWLLQIDYGQIELVTLAQICLKRYGRSVLADLFHQGIDPHKYTAALLLNKTLDQFRELPVVEQKQARQRAKAINFGVPGGLGAASLVAYAKHGYGVQLTIEQAKDFRRRLITQIYPELSTYLQDNQHADIARNLQTTEALTRQVLPRWEQIQTATRIISGCEGTPEGDQYQSDLVHHIWTTLQRLNRNPALSPDLVAQQPSSMLMRKIFYGDAVTLSGRLRGHVGFSQRSNSPFQGLAADGNKLALFRLLRAGYQVCGFVHDEVLIEIPDGTDYAVAVAQVQQILFEAMQELCPDIPISTEYLLADRWYKDVDQQPKDASGRIIPYRRQAAVKQDLYAAQKAEHGLVVRRQASKRTSKSRTKQVYDPETIWSFTPPAADDPATTKLEQQVATVEAKLSQQRTTKNTSAPVPARPAKQKLAQPLKWHGGKHYLANRIIELMPEHTHYVEPYAGGLSVLLQKDPQDISETVNDLDGELINFWRVLASRELFDLFYRQLECTPLAEPLFDAAAQPAVSKVDRAVNFFIRARQSRQGLQRDYTTPTRRTRRTMNEHVSAWLTAVSGLPEIYQRLRRVEIRNMPAEEFITCYDHSGCCFYCDPPYLHNTRSSTGEYAFELTDQQHQELLDVLAGIRGMFVLSGYPSELYGTWAQQHGYRCEQIEIDNKASSAKRKEKKTECIWMNF